MRLLTPPSRPAPRVTQRPTWPEVPAGPELRDERSLRSAMVTEFYYRPLGGVCEHVHYFARGARRRGHHVDIITSHIAGAEKRPNVIRIGHSVRVQANGSESRITL